MLMGYAKVMFPTTAERNYEFKLPYVNYKLNLSMPGFIFSSFLYIGAGCIAWHAFRTTYNIINRARTYFKSLNNAKPYLEPKPLQKKESIQDMTYSAVVYGAATTAGKMFCTYLAKKGFNLIVIERDLSIL